MSQTKRYLEKVSDNRPSWNYLYEENKRLTKLLKEILSNEKRGI